MGKDTMQDRLIRYLEYGITLRISESGGVQYYIIGMTFPPSWAVVEPEDKEVSCLPTSDEGRKGTYYYFTPVSHGIDSLFEAVDETVAVNMEMEKKAALLREKASELQELFISEPYERLVGLRFDLGGDRQQGRGRKRPGKAKASGSGQAPAEAASEDKQAETPTKDEGPSEASDIDAKVAAALAGSPQDNN